MWPVIQESGAGVVQEPRIQTSAFAKRVLPLLAKGRPQKWQVRTSVRSRPEAPRRSTSGRFSSSSSDSDRKRPVTISPPDQGRRSGVDSGSAGGSGSGGKGSLGGGSCGTGSGGGPGHGSTGWFGQSRRRVSVGISIIGSKRSAAERRPSEEFDATSAVFWHPPNQAPTAATANLSDA